MKPKVKFLLPDIQAANKAAESLLLSRIDNKNISFLARPGTNLGDLQAARAIESANIINDGARGLLIGAGIGLFIGVYIHYFQPWITASMNLHWVILAGITTVMGAMGSSIVTAIFGAKLFNTNLDKFKDRIADGAILMIVNVPLHRTNEIHKVVNKLHLKY